MSSRHIFSSQLFPVALNVLQEAEQNFGQLHDAFHCQVSRRQQKGRRSVQLEFHYRALTETLLWSQLINMRAQRSNERERLPFLTTCRRLSGAQEVHVVMEANRENSVCWSTLQSHTRV